MNDHPPTRSDPGSDTPAEDEALGSEEASEREVPSEPRGKGRAPMVEASRSVTFRDFLIFQLKLVLDGLKDVVLFNVSIGAMILDVIAGRGKRPRLFYSVLRVSERFDLWLNLNGALEELESSEVGDDGLFGASRAGSDTLLGKLEELVRGGDEPRG